jgi:hypothetical protein
MGCHRAWGSLSRSPSRGREVGRGHGRPLERAEREGASPGREHRAYALVRISVRRIRIAMTSSCPAARVWGVAAIRLALAALARASPA